MSSRSPFEIGQQIGENFAPSIERQKDYSAIDDIFAQVSEKGSPQDFDSLMAQVIQRVSPQNQQAAMGILQEKKKSFQDQSLNKVHNEQADELEERYPNSKFHSGLAKIYRAKVPSDKKNELIKNYIDTELKGASIAAFQKGNGTNTANRMGPQQNGMIEEAGESVSPNKFVFEETEYDIPEIKTPKVKNVPSEDDIKNISLAFPQQAKLLQEQRKSALKPTEFAQKEESKLVGDFLKDVEKKRSTIASKEMALRGINDAISRQTNFDTIRAQLADMYDIPALRGLTGAELNSRVKELYIEDLARFKNARPNQFLEKMLSSALVDPRNTPGANKIVNVASNAQLEMEKAEIKVKDDLAEFYRNRDGYVPAGIAKEADKVLAPIKQKIMDKAAYESRLIVEENMSDSELRKIITNKNNKPVPGTYLTPRMKGIIEKEFDTPQQRANAAKNLGFSRYNG